MILPFTSLSNPADLSIRTLIFWLISAPELNLLNEPRPWRRNEVYREKYYKYRDRRDQEVIRDSRDSKYFIIERHPEHSKWIKERRDNGKHKGRDKEKHRGEEDDD